MKKLSIQVLLVLVMATVLVSSLVAGVSAAEAPTPLNLLAGLDFEILEPYDKDGDGKIDGSENADTVDNSDFIVSNYGIKFGSDGVVMRQYGSGDTADGRLAVLYPTYIMADQNKGFSELFFSENGPSHFVWEMDVAITEDFGGTGDQNNKTTFPTTRHRGMSLFSYRYTGSSNSPVDAWMLKVTAPGVGKVTFDEEGKMVASVEEGIPNVGYFYTVNQSMNVNYTEESKMGWASGGYSYTNENGEKITPTEGTYMAGYASGAITNAAIDNACVYTLGEEVNLKFEFQRYNGTMYVDIYVDGKLCGSTDYVISKGLGFKFTDLADGDCLSVDDMKITVIDCGGMHSSIWSTNVKTTVTTTNGVAYDYTCNICGGTYGEYPNLIKNEVNDHNLAAGTTFADGKFTTTFTQTYFSSLKKNNGYDYWTELSSAPWWINFDLTVVKSITENEGERESFLTWMPKSDSYNQLLNLHKTTVTENGKSVVKGRVSLYGARSGDWTLYLEQGNSYSFHILVNPATTSYEVYVTDAANGIYNKYFGSTTMAALKPSVAISSNSTYPAMRFGDARAGNYTLSNLTYTRNVTFDMHEHSSELVKDNTVYVDGTTVKHTVYECYCGKNHVEEISEAIVDAIPNFNGGIQTIDYSVDDVDNAQTIGEHWVTTDINLKTLTVDSTLLTIGNTEILKLENGKLVADGYSVDAKAQAYSVAVNINGSEYILYVDGKKVAAGACENATSVTYGDEGCDAHFNYNKIVYLGYSVDGTFEAFVPSVGINPAVKPCVHNVTPDTVVMDLSGATKLSYVCSKCQDRVYDELTDDVTMYTTSNTTTEAAANYDLSSNRFVNLYYNKEDLGRTSAAYWVDFDYVVKEHFGSSDNASNFVNNNLGRNVINFATNYNSVVRVHPISRGKAVSLSSGVETVTDLFHNVFVNFEVFSYDIEVARAVKNDVIHFSFYVDNSTGNVSLYADGEYMYTWAGYLNLDGTYSTNSFRIGDGVSINYSIRDLRFTRTNHVHTNIYSEEPVSVYSAGGWFGLEKYTCYCGETVVKSGVTEYKGVFDSAEVNMYGSVDVPASEDFWFATDMYLYTQNGIDLVSAGNGAILSVSDGNLIIGGNVDTNVDVVTNKAYQIVMQIMPAGDSFYCSLYVEGQYVGIYTCQGALDGKLYLGTDFEAVKFLYPKVVAVGDYFESFEIEYNHEYSSECVHTPMTTDAKFVTIPGETYSSGTKGVNKLVYSHVCATCGDRVYIEQGDVLKVNNPSMNDICPNAWDANPNMGFDVYGNLHDTDSTPYVINAAKYIRTDIASIGNKADPYWLSFDISAPNISAAQVSNIAASGKGNGGSILALQAKDMNIYAQILRGYGVLVEEGDPTTDYITVTYNKVEYKYYNDRIGIRMYQKSRPTKKSDEDFAFILKAGETYNISYYLEPSPEDGTVYHTLYVNGTLVGTKSYVNSVYNALNEHFAIRFLDGNYGDISINNLAFVRANEVDSAKTTLDSSVALGNNVNVFEFSAQVRKLTTENKYYPLVTLNRDYAGLTPIYINASTGDLAYKSARNQYTSLGYALKETIDGDSETIVVVYDEINGTFRYHFDGKVVDGVSAQNSYFTTMDGATEEFVTLLEGGNGGLDVAVTLDNAYTIGTTGTAEVIGFQTNDITGCLRVVSGVKTEYYQQVGGFVELYENDTVLKNAVASHPTVYESFVANDLTARASDYGYKYVSALSIEWNDGTIKFDTEKNYYIIFKPFTVIGDVTYYGEPVKININYSGSKVEFAFDENYSLKLVEDNMDKYVYTMPKYKNQNNSIVVDGSKVMTPVVNGMGGANFYAKDSYFEFVMNPESANAAYIVIDSNVACQVKLYLNGATEGTSITLNVGRNYVPIDGLNAGADNSVKLVNETTSDKIMIFNGAIFDGALVAPAAE